MLIMFETLEVNTFNEDRIMWEVCEPEEKSYLTDETGLRILSIMNEDIVGHSL